MNSNQPLQKINKVNFYVNMKQKVSKQGTKTFPMKNSTMIRPKRKETRKTVRWNQQILKVPWPVYNF